MCGTRGRVGDQSHRSRHARRSPATFESFSTHALPDSAAGETARRTKLKTSQTSRVLRRLQRQGHLTPGSRLNAFIFTGSLIKFIVVQQLVIKVLVGS